MLTLTQIRQGRYIVLEDMPYVVVSAAHSKIGRGGAVLKTKLRNLADGSVLPKTFHGKDKVEEADLSRAKAEFLYKDSEQYNFMDQKTYDQFSLSSKQLGNSKKYLVEGTKVDILYFEDNPINVDLPIKLALTVKEAPPGIKGNTAQGGNKEIVTENGTKVFVPLFIKESDEIIVDTRDGSYVGKA